MVATIETVVIGAGQAGLSTSYILTQRGREHVLFEKASKPGDAWRSERWDSFTFVSPNWSFQLPGGEYDGPDPDGFMTRAELVSRFEAYTEKHRLPIAYNTCVKAVTPLEGGGFRVETEDRVYQARNVVAANGWFQVGKMPDIAAKIPASVFQCHSSGYRCPEKLPPGAVLVVGSGQSGAQIAEELYQSGRKVFLATGTAPHAPRRYRGKDTFRWLIDSGFTDRTWEQMKAQTMGHTFVAPMFSGKNGGHALNLHRFYRDGVILLGHALDYADGKLTFAPDLKQNLARADAGQKGILQMFDAYIERAGIDAPPATAEERAELTDAYQAPEITTVDLQAEGIGSIIWACGYQYRPSFFRMPVLDKDGLPDAPEGVSRAYPGLYFVGFPFLPTLKSGFFAGVAECAGRIAARIGG